MVSAKLYGGLGNQMFQIAAAEALAKRNDDVAVFDFDDCKVYHQGNPSNAYKETLFNNIKTQNSFFIKTTHLYKDMGSVYNNIPYLTDIMLDGYFQSEKYFKDQAEHIVNIFMFSDKIKNEVFNFVSQIKDDKQLTSVHIRRGDYLKFSHVHPICTVDYYTNAMSLFPNNHFVIISDDMDWVRNTFKGDNISYSIGDSDIFDLCLMASCDNNIIANSSFGWWGSWLNQNPNKKIIAPKLWFVDRDFDSYKDIYTDNMILL